jgi:acyl carrier protein
MAAAHAATARRLEALGLRALSEDAGLNALGALLVASCRGVSAQLSVVIADMNPVRLIASAPTAQPRMRSLFGNLLSDAAAAVATTDSALIMCEHEIRRAAVAPSSATRVGDSISAAVGRLVGRELDPAEPLAGAGLDSLGALELRALLGATFGLELPATLAFDFPSVEAITTFVLSALGDNAAELGATAAPQTRALAIFTEASAEGEPCLILASGGARTDSLLGQWTGAAPVAAHDGVSVAPLSRWDVDARAPTPRFLAALPRVEMFDAELFSVSSAEAAVMDPHQRLLLQVRFESHSRRNQHSMIYPGLAASRKPSL